MVYYQQTFTNVRLFVAFDIFKTIFLKEKAIYDHVSLPAQTYDFISELLVQPC